MINNKSIAAKISTTFVFLFILLCACPVLCEENQIKDIIKRVTPATVLVQTFKANGDSIAIGSGFFTNVKGEVVTNYHVIKDAEKITVTTSDGKVYKISGKIAESVKFDLVKLQADIGNNAVSFLQLSKASVEAGEKIIVVGNPQGLQSTVSDGIISAVREVQGFGNIIQITAPISAGSSGSPVLNMRGEVIGVASAQIREGQNLNFVMPSENITELKETILKPLGGKEKSSAETKSDDSLETGLFYWFKDDYKKATPYFEKYLEKHPDSPDVWCWLGLVYSHQGLYDEGINAFKQAIRLKPDDVMAYINLGVVYDRQGRNEEAINAYKQAIKIKPDYADAYLNLGVVYDNQGHYEEAINAYKQAIRLKPDYADAYLNLGVVYGKQGHYEEAINAFKLATRIKPDEALAHYYLGFTYLILKNTGNALDEYKVLKNIDAEKANELFNLIYK